MAYIKTLKDNELMGGADNSDVYPVSSTQAIYSQTSDGLAPEGVKRKLEDRLVDIESDITDLQERPECLCEGIPIDTLDSITGKDI